MGFKSIKRVHFPGILGLTMYNNRIIFLRVTLRKCPLNGS